MKAVGSAVSSWWQSITPLITFSQPLVSTEETPITFTLPMSKEDQACSHTLITEDVLCSYPGNPCHNVVTYTQPLERQGMNPSYTRPSNDDVVETYSDPLEYLVSNITDSNITDISPLPEVDIHCSSAGEHFTTCVQPLPSTEIQTSTSHSLWAKDDADDAHFQGTLNGLSDDSQMLCRAKQYTSNKTDQAPQIVPINDTRPCILISHETTLSPLETKVQQGAPQTECTNSPQILPRCNTGIKCCCSTECSKQSQYTVCLDGQFQHTIAKHEGKVLVLPQHLPDVTTIMQLSHSTQAMLRAKPHCSNWTPCKQVLTIPGTASPFTQPSADRCEPLAAIRHGTCDPYTTISLTGGRFTNCIQIKYSLTKHSRVMPCPHALQKKACVLKTDIQAMLDAQTLHHLDETTFKFIQGLMPFTPWIEQLLKPATQQTRAVAHFIQLQPYAERKLKTFKSTKLCFGAEWSVESMKAKDSGRKSFNLSSLIHASPKQWTQPEESSENTQGHFVLSQV